MMQLIEFTIYPKKYAHGFVVLCFVVVMQSFIMNSHEVFIHIRQGCFAGTGAIVRLPQCQWSKPDGYGKISQCITTTKHSKAKTVCIFLGIYCSTKHFSRITLKITYFRCYFCVCVCVCVCVCGGGGGQRRSGALMFSLICAWIYSWVSNREAGVLRCYRAHYEVTVIRKKCPRDYEDNVVAETVSFMMYYPMCVFYHFVIFVDYHTTLDISAKVMLLE